MFEAAELILTGPEQDADPDQPVLTMYVTYRIESRIPELDGLSGSFTAVPERKASREGTQLKNWWSDILDPEYAEGIHRGARWVNIYRRDFLQDFAERLARCKEEK